MDTQRRQQNLGTWVGAGVGSRRSLCALPSWRGRSRVLEAQAEPGWESEASVARARGRQCLFPTSFSLLVLGPLQEWAGSKGGYHLVRTPRVAPRTSKRSVGWDKLIDLGVMSGKGAFVSVFEVHKPSPDGLGCGSANSQGDAWGRPELPRCWPPDVLRYTPSTAASPSGTLSSAPPHPSKTPLGS